MAVSTIFDMALFPWVGGDMEMIERMRKTGEFLIVTCGQPRFEDGSPVSMDEFDNAIKMGLIEGNGDSFFETLNQTYKLTRVKNVKDGIYDS